MKIYIDFDGTITRRDVGDAMFERFGGAASTASIEVYRRGEISAAECFRRESAACGIVDLGALNTFLDRQEIDDTFRAFVDFCRSHEFECYILSDGMDYYIRRILEKNGLGDVPFYSNHMELVPARNNESVQFVPIFPYTDEVCDRCACCKRNHLLTMTADEELIVYIGEGYSDRCPVRYADLVFAKDDLLHYCRQEEIPHDEYATFADITARLRQLIEKHRARPGRTHLHKRRQAELARREAFISE